jgi:ACS family allantoate permease-like MFS transporter
MGRMLSCYMICWGIVVLCIGFTQNFTQLITLRALQGIFECCISPGFILVIGSWYTTREHASRSLVFQSANAGFGVIASLIMYGLGVAAQRNKNDEAWRYISYVSSCIQLTIRVKLISYSSWEG